jgi:phospholipid/cholesterol/gamma-HCH transport system substrate-binding protein
METRANYVLIGVFTLAVIVGAFGFVWWFERLGEGGSRATYEISYEGSVSGLRKGSAVNFNGIRVGEVYNLVLDPADPRRVIAQIGVATNTPVRKDTRAGLDFQGLTGIATVTLTGGLANAPAIPAEKGKYPRIVAEPTSDVMTAARQTMNRIDKLIAQNEERIEQIVKSIASITNDLDKGVVADIGAAAKSVREAADALGNQTEPTLKEYRLLAQDARRAVADISRFIRDLEKNPSQLVFGKKK